MQSNPTLALVRYLLACALVSFAKLLERYLPPVLRCNSYKSYGITYMRRRTHVAAKSKTSDIT